MRHFRCAATAVFLNFVFVVSAALATDVEFRVTAKEGMLAGPYDGRVYVILGKADGRQPLDQLGWVNPAPLFAVDVKDWDGVSAVTISGDPVSHPLKLTDVEPGTYSAQALIRTNPYVGSLKNGSGNLKSVPVAVEVLADGTTSVDLMLDTVHKAARPDVPDGYKYIEFESKALSDFHGIPWKVPALVRLPAGWNEEDSDKWPVVYYQTGFGGGYAEFLNVERQFSHLKPALDKVIVVAASAEGFRGHTVFADSENNGPWGQMLVDELAPWIDQEFGGKGPEARYVTGISSGGWSSIWVQVEYPDAFNGVWSHVPDPVDFRDFQQMDLYSGDTAIFRDNDGERRPISRPLGPNKYVIYVDDFVAMEEALGPGGQYHAFSAVFSPRGEDGEPMQFFDSETGKVNGAVIENWKKYDIRLKLLREWGDLKDRLAGKLHIYAGAVDSFYLEGAVALLKTELENLGSDAVVEVIPDMPHTFAPGVWEAMLEEITGIKTQKPEPVAAE